MPLKLIAAMSPNLAGLSLTGIIFAIKYKENQNLYAHKISNSIEQNKNGKNKHTKTYDLQITA